MTIDRTPSGPASSGGGSPPVVCRRWKPLAGPAHLCNVERPAHQATNTLGCDISLGRGAPPAAVPAAAAGSLLPEQKAALASSGVSAGSCQSRASRCLKLRGAQAQAQGMQYETRRNVTADTMPGRPAPAPHLRAPPTAVAIAFYAPGGVLPCDCACDGCQFDGA